MQTVVTHAGIPRARTLSFIVSLFGNLIIFGQILYARTKRRTPFGAPRSCNWQRYGFAYCLSEVL